jgi:predicted outer membrane repeat protein
MFPDEFTKSGIDIEMRNNPIHGVMRRHDSQERRDGNVDNVGFDSNSAAGAHTGGGIAHPGSSTSNALGRHHI